MAVLYYLLAALCTVSAAPQSQRAYPQHSQLQQLSALDYYLDNPEVANYYQQSQHEQKRASENAPNNGPARFEALDPNTEVELIPGGGQPQQPPQQTPLVPNAPGFIPGQRVFITYMPIPGYREWDAEISKDVNLDLFVQIEHNGKIVGELLRTDLTSIYSPGTVRGYQPVYIVGAEPQGNGGYQNPNVGLLPAGYHPGVAPGQINPNLYYGPYQPYKLAYQEPVLAYQPVQNQQGNEAPAGVFRLAQVVSLQGQQSHPANEAKQNNEPSNNQKTSQATQESKEQAQNVRPATQSQRKA